MGGGGCGYYYAIHISGEDDAKLTKMRSDTRWLNTARYDGEVE